MKMPKAYSYLRFSTPEQSKGDSSRRQTKAARDYAERHRLDLDEQLTFKDLGVSGYRGDNLKGGALGAFIDAVDAGIVRKGSYLLVENLDRLSRLPPRRALDQFTKILERGVYVVTLTDGKRYTAESIDENFTDLLISLTIMNRAHEESAMKAMRLGASWQSKRDKLQAGGDIKLTARCPAWLSLNREKTEFIVDKDREKVVKRIFDMTIAGHGKSVIARRFNVEGILTFGESDGWHPSYIQKILESEAVTGVFQPMKMDLKGGKKTRVPDGDPIQDYFPTVVTRATFERARRLRSARRIPTGRKGKDLSNLFTGLMFCGNCGATMHYVNKGREPKGGIYLICSNVRRAASNCNARPWKYGPVEALIVLCMEELNYDEIFPEITRNTREALQQLENTKLEKDAELLRFSKGLENLADALEQNSKQPTLMARLNTTQAAFDSLSAEIIALNERIEVERERAKNAERDFRQVQDGLQRLNRAHEIRGPELYDLRSRLHQLLKRTVQDIKLHPASGPAFAPQHSGDWFGAIAIQFQNAKTARALYVEKGLKACHSVPVRNGKEDYKRGTILRAPPQSKASR